jgi:hypothetical protein
MYHCTLWCVATLTRQHILTSSTCRFWASLGDDTWLFTHLSFCYSIYNHVAPETINEHFNKATFLHNLALTCCIGLASTGKDIAMRKLRDVNCIAQYSFVLKITQTQHKCKWNLAL